MSLTSANRPSTASVASSGTPRRRSAASSCARVLGAAASSFRQICRATASGSASPTSGSPGSPGSPGPTPRRRAGSPGPAPRRREDPPRRRRGPGPNPPGSSRRPPGSGDSSAGPPRPAGASAGPPGIRLVATAGYRLESGRRGARALRRSGRLRVQARPDAELLLDLLLDLVGQVRVLLQEVPGVLLALAELVALVGVPGPGLAHDRLFHAEVDQAALPADAHAVQDVELRGLERRAHLVLHDLDPGPVPDRVRTVLERLDTPNIETNRRIKLQRLSARGRFGRPEHD